MGFLQFLSVDTLLSFLPLILIKVGNQLKKKDADNTGKDDAFGNLLIALAPAVSALEDNNESAFKKSLRVARDTLTNYLGE